MLPPTQLQSHTCSPTYVSRHALIRITVAAGAVVSDAVREKLQQKQKLLEAADAAAPLSEVQMAQMKGQMALAMQDGETVMQALKRLGGKQQSVRGACCLPHPCLHSTPARQQAAASCTALLEELSRHHGIPC